MPKERHPKGEERRSPSDFAEFDVEKAELSVSLSAPRSFDPNNLEQVRMRLTVLQELEQQGPKRRRMQAERQRLRRRIIASLHLEIRRLRNENAELRRRL